MNLHSILPEEVALQEAANLLNKNLVLIVADVRPNGSAFNTITVYPFVDLHAEAAFEFDFSVEFSPLIALEKFIEGFAGLEPGDEKCEKYPYAWLVANASKEEVAIAAIPQPSLQIRRILEEIRIFVLRFIVFPKKAHAAVISLWIAHTWAIEAFEYSPYLHIQSPMPRCGKSILLDCLSELSQNPWPVISPTEAVMYRKIEADFPTVLLDEVDTIYKGNDDRSKEGLRALFNCGFQRGATVPRCMGSQGLFEYHVFCPKALAGIGRLPNTVADRSILILLARRAEGEIVEGFRKREAGEIAQPIREQLNAWIENKAVISDLHAARPAIPDELGDRAADICEPLLAIADMAGGEWPKRARLGLVELCTGGEAQDENIGVKLLNACREIFRKAKTKHISTKGLLAALIARETDEPWALWWERELAKGNVRGPAAKMAQILKPFGIVVGTIREGNGSTPKGYKFESFQDAFTRYLPKNAP